MQTKLDKILFYMFYCHKLPERSFHYKGKQFPICARCTGILLGYLLGIIGVVLFQLPIHYPTLLIGMILIAPLALDGLGQYYGYWLSNNRRRFLTGILGGIAFIYMCRFVIELATVAANYALEYIGK